MGSLMGFFLDSPEGLDDPFAELARLREEQPVLRHAPLGQWFVFAYDDVRAALADPRLSPDRLEGFAGRAPPGAVAALRRAAPWLVEPATDHGWLRPVLLSAYGAAGAGPEGTMDAVAAGLLAAAGPAFDLAGDFAFPFAERVLCDFLGVPRADGEALVRWSLDLVDFFTAIPLHEQPVAPLAASLAELAAYAGERLAGGLSPGGLLALVAEAAPPGADAAEVVAAVMLPVLGGHVAVRQLIGNAAWLLLTHPRQLDAVRADRELLAGAVEEALRVEPPVPLIPRTALEPLELRGLPIAAGAVLQLSLAAANRDPARFADPDRFDVARRPAGALALGYGPYSCAGARLVRLQARAALAALLDRRPGLALDPARAIAWCRTAGARGPDVLPVRDGAPRA
jgi:cytochrome P450